MPLSLSSSAPLRLALRRMRLRDAAAGAALFAATAAVVLWQNAHAAVLWDIAYTLDSSMRIAAGQMPYRDFPFVHAPLTFLIQAAIIRLTGRVFFHHVLYAALVGGMGTVLAWRIALRTLRGRVAHDWIVALLLAAPLAVLGLYCIVPHPSYDCDCAFFMLVAIWMLQRLEPDESAMPQPDAQPNVGWAKRLATGAAICVPLFAKQNMGPPFLLAALGAVSLLLVTKQIARDRSGTMGGPRAQLLWAVFAGAAGTLAFAALLLHLTAGISNYLYWTITFAGQRRLPTWSAMLGIYRDPNLLWTLPSVAIGWLLVGMQRGPTHKSPPRWRSLAGFALIAAPFLFALSSLLRYDDADERGDSLLALWPLLLILASVLAAWRLVKTRRNLTMHAFMPFVLLAGVHGTFLSQQLWGSTYAIWPLLILLIAQMLADLAGYADGDSNPDLRGASAPAWLLTAFAALIAITLLICGAFYVASEERLSYADLPDGPIAHSSYPALAGLSLAGPYLPEFDELLRYAAAHIPGGDGIILLPGEDPFYFATGRVPQFPVLLFDPATDPYSPNEIAALAQARNIRWLIVKRKMQMKTNPMPQPDETLTLLQSRFALETHLAAYDIYRRP